MGLQYALDALIAQGKEDILLRLKNDPNLIGPGKVERLELRRPVAGGNEGETVAVVGVYRMLAHQLVQTDARSQPRPMTVPITFAVEDISVIIEAPINEANESALITPGGKNARGLVIPGRS